MFTAKADSVRPQIPRQDFLTSFADGLTSARRMEIGGAFHFFNDVSAIVFKNAPSQPQ